MNPMEGDPGAALQQKSWNQLLDLFDHALLKAADREPHIGRVLHGAHINSRSLFLAAVALFLALSLPKIVIWALRKCHHLEKNFQGDFIPQSFGLLILLFSGALISICLKIYSPADQTYLPWLAAVVGFGLLGLLDDALGNKTIKGLRGHLRAAAIDHRITTGFIKAFGGGLLALYIGRMIEPQSIYLTVLDACIIALAANALNLLDLRPGRASGFFLLSALILISYHSPLAGNGVPPLLLILIPAALVWSRDSRAGVMMGDTGSNLLGASLGVGLCSTIFSVTPKVVFLIILILLHLLAERKSFSQIIENNRFLRTLDGLTGVR